MKTKKTMAQEVEKISEDQKIRNAYELLQQHKVDRENAFKQELDELCKKYGVSLTTKILITAL